MIQKIRTKLLAISALLLFAIPATAPMIAHADQISGGVCYGANNLKISVNPGDTCPPGTEATTKVNTLLTDIINIFSVVVGIAAVIMIIVGGFRYITSGGSSDKVTSAKNTLLYAIIGLVIVALAQVIVKFVLGKTVG